MASRRGLYQRFQETAARAGLWRSGERLIVGVSGGPDSVALLHLLLATGNRAVAVHVNHGWRGRQSDADEAFVHSLCADWGCAFESLRVSETARQGKSPEEFARTQRYGFFAEVAGELRVRTVVVGHTADDQAETFLLRLLRGSGRRGLGGMRGKAPLPAPGSKLSVVRPLLRARRSEILDYLRDNGIPFRRDRSNEDESLARNRVRRRLIPWLEREFQPAVVPVLARTAEILGEEDALLEKGVPPSPRSKRIAAASLRKLPEPHRIRLLQNWLGLHGWPALSWERAQAVSLGLERPSGGRIELGGGRALEIGRGRVRLA
ncbi:MAG: tRNA lysidine(34) synthetase TilS [Verrucomicrobiae bacterium]|nr:tRNA lysidine(34) synthetase TilS [Verrucomicrobiae bacterium]